MVKRPVGLKEGAPSPSTLGDQDDADPQAKPQGPMAKWAPAICLLVLGLIIVAVVVSSASAAGDVDIAFEHHRNGSSLRGAPSDKSSVLDAEGASAKANQAGASPGAAAQPQPVASSNPVAIFNTTMGSFTAEIYVDRVPISSSNFIDLSKSGFYDGLYFHRVIPNFMAQFGDDSTRDKGTKGPKKGGGTTFRNLKTGSEEKRLPGGNIKDEHISKDSNKPGTLSMANTGAPNSGGAQFFINVHDNSYLDWFTRGPSKHPVFGKVLKGYNVVKAITEVKTRQDRPIKPIQMTSIIIQDSAPPAIVP